MSALTYVALIEFAVICVLGFFLCVVLMGHDEQVTELLEEIDQFEGQVVGLSEMNTEKAAVIRRLQIRAANHPSTRGGAS